MIGDYTKFWNQNGNVFKVLVFDKDSEELPEITNVNDINKGAIHNTLEWTRRWGLRCVSEAALMKSSGILLDSYGDLLGYKRNPMEPDVEYKNRILSNILLAVATMSSLDFIINNQDVSVHDNTPQGFFGHSFYGVGAESNTIASSVMGYSRNTVYIIFKTNEFFDKSMLLFLNKMKAAGTRLFIGFENYV